MESTKSAETSVPYYQPTKCYISEELIRHKNAVITLNCTQMLRFPPLCICQQYRKSYSCNKMSVWLSGFLLKARRTQPRDRILTAAQGFNSRRRQQTVAYSGILFGGRGVGSTNSVEDRGQRERGPGGGSPLFRGSGGSCTLVQEISFHIVKFS